MALALQEEALMPLIRVSPQARRMSLRIDSARGRALLVVPSGTPRRLIDRFIDSRRDWIRDHLEGLPPRIRLLPGASLPLRGAAHLIRHEATAPRRPDCQPGAIRLGGPSERVEQRLISWLKAEARRDLLSAVERHCDRLGVGAGRLSLRDTTSRWGSCTAKGDLGFNWRLILAPPFVLDYVAAHEVSHRREMNHSRRFWTLVDQLTPDARPARDWLKQSGASLFRYGPPRDED